MLLFKGIFFFFRQTTEKFMYSNCKWENKWAQQHTIEIQQHTNWMTLIVEFANAYKFLSKQRVITRARPNEMSLLCKLYCCLAFEMFRKCSLTILWCMLYSTGTQWIRRRWMSVILFCVYCEWNVTALFYSYTLKLSAERCAANEL